MMILDSGYLQSIISLVFSIVTGLICVKCNRTCKIVGKDEIFLGTIGAREEGKVERLEFNTSLYDPPTNRIALHGPRKMRNNVRARPRADPRPRKKDFARRYPTRRDGKKEGQK